MFDVTHVTCGVSFKVTCAVKKNLLRCIQAYRMLQGRILRLIDYVDLDLDVDSCSAETKFPFSGSIRAHLQY